MEQIMSLNITLIVAGIIALFEVIKGFKRGMVKEISGFIALVITLFVGALLIMLISSYQDGETKNTIIAAILLVMIGLVYGIVNFVLKSVKALSKLPVINVADSMLGLVLGACKTVAIIWIVFLIVSEGYFPEVSSKIMEDVSNSQILTWLYDNNFLLKF